VSHRAANLSLVLAGASAIVFVRGLFEFDHVLKAASSLRMPLYYFSDDHFILLHEQNPQAKFVERYSADSVAAALRDYAGVLAATPSLVDDYTQRRLHERIEVFPPSYTPVVASSQTGRRDAAHLAFFGGQHLHETFLGTMLPAIRRFALTRPVHLFAVGLDTTVAGSAGLTITQLPYQPYLDGVRRLAAIGIDVLMHPLSSALPNNRFKNPHALLTAYTLGAIPLVSGGAPYDTAATRAASIVAGDSEQDWHDALVAATDVERAAAVRVKLAAYCADFDGAINRDVIAKILASHPHPDALTRLSRLMAFSFASAARVAAGIRGRLRRTFVSS
jgi:hypothetical protein